MKNNMLTEINEGNSHENNKYGGVPMGLSSNGKQNTVEQNETIKNNFVYSDRLYINEDLAKANNLPGYIKGKSFASASKAINDKFKDRNDIHTKATQKELLDRLAQSQEQLKAEQEAINQSMQINQSEVDYPEETQQFKTGGPMGILGGGENGILGGTSFEQDSPDNSMSKYNGSLSQSSPFGDFISKNKGSLGNAAGMLGASLYGQDSKKEGTLNTLNSITDSIGGPVGQYGRVATGAYDAGSELFGKSDVDTSGNTVLQGVDTGKAAAKGALKGAQAGMTFGPLGAGVGAAIGGVAGLVGGNKDKKAVAKNNEIFFRKDNFYKYQFNENNDDTQVFALGGELETDPPIKKSITVDNTQNVQNKINETLGTTDTNGKVGTSKLMGEIKLINKRNDGYGILYDTDEGDKYEVVKSNAFTGMQDLPELKRYRYKRGEYSDPNFLEDGRNVEALKKGWQSSGYNPNLVTYPQSVEAYRAAIGQPAFYTPEQLTTMSKQYAKGGLLDNINLGDPNNVNPLFKKPGIPDANYIQNKSTSDIFPNGIYKSQESIPYNRNNDFPNGIYQAPVVTDQEYLLNNKGKYNPNIIKDIQARSGAFVDGDAGKETYVKSGLRYDGTNYPINLNADKALESALATPDSEVKPEYTLDDIKNMESSYNTTVKNRKPFDFKQVSDKFGNALRYAPVLGNILQKNKIGPAEVESAIKNPYQYKKQYIDEAQYRNAADQQAALSMEALNKSGLSGNQLMAASLGSQLERTKGVAEGAMAAKMHNLNENKIAEQVKQQNEGDFITDSRYVRETNAQNRANRDTQISKFDSEIYNSLGDIGKEELFKKQAEKLTGYKMMGEYMMADPNYKSQYDAIQKDSKLTPKEKYAKEQKLIQEYYKGFDSKAQEQVSNSIKETATAGHAYGGYMSPKFKKY